MVREGGRVLGIDHGKKRVGVAMSDPFRLLAQPVATFENNEELTGNIRSIIAEQGVTLIVVGMPYAPDGGKGKTAAEVDRFIEELKTLIEVPIETWDESYSSENARQVFIQGGMKKKKRQGKAHIDVMAARLMLQDYLDSRPSA